MRKLRTGLLPTLAAIGALAFPAAASAEYLVPPGNSAATQYTETVPTAGGQRNAEKEGKKGGSPSEILGHGKARRLDEHGQEGREVAEFTAETAPVTAEPEDATTTGDGTGDGESQSDKTSGRDDEKAGAGGGKGPGKGGPDGPPRVDLGDPAGSSGTGSVLGEATGLSSSEALLLFSVLGSIAWALAFLWRRRDRSMA